MTFTATRPLAFAFAFVTALAPRAAYAHGRHGGACDGACEHPRDRGADHDGPRLGIHRLLEGVELRAEQREAVTKLHRAAMDDRELVHGATRAYRAELARQVRAGAIDEKALDGLRIEAAANLAALPPVHVTMLAKLHAILDKPQRAQVAERLVAPPRGPERDDDRGGPEGGRGERDDPPGKGDAGRPRHHHGAHGHERGPGMHRLRALAEELALTPSQHDAIREAMHAAMKARYGRADHRALRAEMERRHQGLAERFRADTFAVTDADKVPAELAAGRVAHLSVLPIVATPTLTPNQRMRLAETIERGRQDDEP